MRILIGYDGSPCAEAALADLARAGLPDVAQATVLTAMEVFPPLTTSSPEPGADYLLEEAAVVVRRAEALALKAAQEARATCERGAGRVHRLFPAWDVRTETSDESPATALVGKAEAWKANLVVVGSHGRAVLERAVLGSVSRHVLHHAPCSVRIARTADQAGGADRPVRLVVGIDASPQSSAAVAAVAARSWPRSTEVHVVAVIDSRMILTALDFAARFAPGLAGGDDDGVAAVLEHHLGAAAEALRKTGLTIGTNLIAGDPKRVLLHEAKRHGADCIFLGWKGHGRTERLLLGSVASAVGARAHCSVEVVRPSP
jgi:nucleotide-binding universal stress UspA family protein